MDRIDMWVNVDHVAYEDLGRGGDGREKTFDISERVARAREKQKQRFGKEKLNSEMSVKDISQFVVLSSEVETLLNETAQKLSLSPRSYHRVIKLARTIADLENSETIEQNHILEALQYRPKTK
jgi:magnesium chelatase family protein